MDHAPLADGFARIHVTLSTEPGDAAPTPGELAQRCQIPAESLGLIRINGNQALVDVEDPFAEAACLRLNELGRARIADRQRPEIRWAWLLIQVGRTHGMTMGYLKKLLERAASGPVGKIHIQNEYTLVGLHGDRIQSVADFLNRKPINGIKPRAREAEAAEHRGEEPRYIRAESRPR
jgi:hypothetical protein